MIAKVVVVIEDNTTELSLKAALPSHMQARHLEGNDYLVFVEEARDAEEEVTKVLNDAWINAFVYETNKEFDV
jgi:hypothetical protein